MKAGITMAVLNCFGNFPVSMILLVRAVIGFDDLRRFPTVQPALHPFWIAYHRICLKVSCFAIPCLIYLITFQVGNSLDLFAIHPILCCCPLRLFPIFLVYIYQVLFRHVPLMFVFQVLYFCMYHF